MAWIDDKTIAQMTTELRRKQSVEVDAKDMLEQIYDDMIDLKAMYDLGELENRRPLLGDVLGVIEKHLAEWREKYPQGGE